VHTVMKINTSILNSAFSKYYHYLFKLEVIQDTRGDLGHIEKIAVECVSLLYIAPYPPRFQVGGWTFRWVNGFCFDSFCGGEGCPFVYL